MPTNNTMLIQAMDEWRQRVALALVRAENDLTRERHPEAKPHEWQEVYTASTPKQMFALLNWKVWTLRYKITPEFLVLWMLHHYTNARKPSKDPNVLTLGLPLAAVTGAKCRQHLENYLDRIYPNGENLKSAACAQPKIVELTPGENWQEAYDREMRRRHTSSSEEEPSQGRNYRKV